MVKYDFEEDSSEEEYDDVLMGDIDYVTKALVPSDTAGANPKVSSGPDVANDFAEVGGDGYAGTEVEFSDSDDDFELVRDIKQNYGGGGGSDLNSPLSLKPLMTLPPISSDDDDDDLETLRAIRMRFAQYCGNDNKCSSHDRLRSNEDHDIGHKSSENGNSGHLFENDSANKDTVNQEGEGCTFPDDFDQFLDCEDDDLPSENPNFPKSAQLSIDAIKKNRSYQQFLRNNMLHMELKMEAIKDLMKCVKTYRDYDLALKRKIGRAFSQKQGARIQLIVSPKSRAELKGKDKKTSDSSCGPPENSRVANYRMALTNFPQFVQQEKWSNEEKESLKKGIMQQFQDMLLKKSADLFSVSEGQKYSDEVDKVVTLIKDVQISPESFRPFISKVNWEQLASIYVPRRSAAECEARWLNWEDQLINHSNWTTMEDKNLLAVLHQKGIYDWADITMSLGTNRTPFHCLARYQRSLNPSILNREWTEEEDAQLCNAVKAYGESNWQVVASALKGRTGTQCSNRWLKALHPTIERKGKWYYEEDKRLKIAVTLFGPKSWNKIAQFVPGRSQVQCRERWVNKLDPSLNHGKWTKDDDLKLKEAIAKHGYCWTRVASCVPKRTDNQCMRRWKVLFPHEVDWRKAAKDVQRLALVSNFVDRESERPAIGPDDFVPLHIAMPEYEKIIDSRKRKRRFRSGSKLVGEMASCHVPKKPRSSRHKREGFPSSDRGTLCRHGAVSSQKRRVHKSHLKKKKSVPSTEDESSSDHSSVSGVDDVEAVASKLVNPRVARSSLSEQTQHEQRAAEHMGSRIASGFGANEHGEPEVVPSESAIAVEKLRSEATGEWEHLTLAAVFDGFRRWKKGKLSLQD